MLFANTENCRTTYVRFYRVEIYRSINDYPLNVANIFVVILLWYMLIVYTTHTNTNIHEWIPFPFSLIHIWPRSSSSSQPAKYYTPQNIVIRSMGPDNTTKPIFEHMTCEYTAPEQKPSAHSNGKHDNLPIKIALKCVWLYRQYLLVFERERKSQTRNRFLFLSLIPTFSVSCSTCAHSTHTNWATSERMTCLGLNLRLHLIVIIVSNDWSFIWIAQLPTIIWCGLGTLCSLIHAGWILPMALFIKVEEGLRVFGDLNRFYTEPTCFNTNDDFP